MIGMYDRNNMRTSPRDFVRWGRNGARNTAAGSTASSRR